MSQLQKNQFKVLIFLILSVGFLLISILSMWQKSSRSNLSYEDKLEALLKEDRQLIREALAREAPDDLKKRDLQSLLRLSQANDPLLVDAALAWGETSNLEAMNIIIGGLGPYIYEDPRVEPFLETLFEQSAPWQKQNIIRAVLWERSVERLKMAQDFFAKWPQEQSINFDYLYALSMLLRSYPESLKTSSWGPQYKEVFSKWLLLDSRALDRINIDRFRILLQTFVDIDGNLSNQQKEILNNILKQISYDPKIESGSFKTISEIIN